MRNVWVVFGATGQQGGAVARTLTRDTVLSKTISVRAAVRDPSSPAAESLQDPGCEVVQADLDNKESLIEALKGATGVFLITANTIAEDFYPKEFQQGKNAADAAVECGVQKVIFSTLPSVKNITKGKLTKVVHFDAKYDIEQYIRPLPIESSFVALGAFMQNFTTVMRPQPVGDGTFAIKTSIPSSTVLPLVDATDIGQIVVQMVKDFDRFRGRTIHVAAELKSLDEAASMIGKANGQIVKYVQISPDEFLAPLPEAVAEDWADFGPYMSEYGYFGPATKTMRFREFVELTTFEAFLKEGNVELDG